MSQNSPQSPAAPELSTDPPAGTGWPPGSNHTGLMPSTCLLVTDHDLSLDLISAAAAALDVTLISVSSRDPIAAQWAKADRILLGAEAAGTVAGLRLPERGGVSVLAFAPQLGEGATWSGALRVPLVQLPDVAGQLTQAMGGPEAGPIRAPLVVVGASGGVGTSTLAAGLACCASQRDQALLLDLDPGGGGLDLLMGLEGQPGWRWHDLAEASGEFSLAGEQLPSCNAVSVLAMGRGRIPLTPTLAGVGSIMRAARRGFETVVVDCRRDDIDAIAMLNGFTVVVVGGHVRGLAAARALLDSLAEAGISAHLVLRRGTRSGVGLDTAERALRQPFLTEIPYDRRLALLAEQGAAPWAGASRRWRKRLTQIRRADPAEVSRAVGGLEPSSERVSRRRSPLAGKRSVQPAGAGQ